MKVRVQFYAQLRDLLGMRQLDVDIAEGGNQAVVIGRDREISRLRSK